MSIASEISRISQNVSDSLTAVAAKGVTVPSGSTSDDLPELIAAIQTGSGSAITITDTTDSHGGIIRTITGVSLAGDTVTAAHLESGYTAHDSMGNAIVGTLSPGGEADYPTFTLTFDDSFTTLVSATCDKTYSQCYSYKNNSQFYASFVVSNNNNIFGGSCKVGQENPLIYYIDQEGVAFSAIMYASDGTITMENNPVPRRSSSDLTVNGPYVTAPVGYYQFEETVSVASGTAGTPTATKGTVSNHSVSVTPSVTNTTGYITGSTKTGTAVTVSASELVSGNKEINQNGTNIDVANYSTVSVAVPASEPNLQAKTNISPTTSSQTITADNGYDGLSSVQINAMPTMTLPTSAAASATSGYSSKATISRSTSDQYINIPTGYNTTGAYYKISAVANGSVTAPSTISGTSATVSTGTNTLTLTKTVSVTPNVTTAGYISSGTAGNSSVSLTASVTTQAAQTIHPSTTDQSIAASRYLTGAQTIKAVTHNLDASKILSGTTFKIGDSSDDDCVASVAGTVTFQTIYSGSSAPSSSTGVNGDVYIQTA